MARGIELRGRQALVTGAASGIGRALALALAERGAHLQICDIDEAGLEATAERARRLGVEATTAVVDVADREAMAGFAASVHGAVGAVDVLVNNAGVALSGAFLETPLEDWDWIVGINLWGVIHGLHYFLPPMAKRGSGHVVNIASMAGLVGFEQISAYCATKFAVVGISESLFIELEPLGIGVTVVCPGPINTPIVESARGRGKADSPEFRERMRSLFQRRNYTPERLARHVMKAIAANRPLQRITPEAHVGHMLKRVSPSLLRFAQRQVRDRLVGDLLRRP